MTKTLTFVRHNGTNTATFELTLFADGTGRASIHNTAEAGGPHKIELTSEDLFELWKNLLVTPGGSA